MHSECNTMLHRHPFRASDVFCVGMCFHLEWPVSCTGTFSPVASLLPKRALKVIPDGGSWRAADWTIRVSVVYLIQFEWCSCCLFLRSPRWQQFLQHQVLPRTGHFREKNENKVGHFASFSSLWHFAFAFKQVFIPQWFFSRLASPAVPQWIQVYNPGTQHTHQRQEPVSNHVISNYS